MSNTFTREGYIFAGWASSANGSKVYDDEQMFAIGTNKLVVLYALWTANDNTVTFNKNAADAAGSMGVQIISTGNKTNLTFNGFTRAGYTFAGWAESEGGGVKHLNGSSYTMGTKDVTLYAVWVSEDCWLVTFDPQGGSEVISQQIPKGNKPVVPAMPTKAGYVFDGWYKEPQCKNIWDFERNEVTGNIIIYANWKLKENTLVFNGNAADITGTMEDMKLAPGNRAALPSNVFARTGYTFAGWAASADGEVIYLDGADYTMGEEESYTLYAVWVDNTRWLATFNSQGEVPLKSKG